MVALKPVLQKGVKVSVLTRPLTEYKEADLEKAEQSLALMRDAGIKLILRENMHQRLTVIDNSIVWFGSISFLGYSKKDASVLRINNRDLAVGISADMLQ